jgi:hypothetical protein
MASAGSKRKYLLFKADDGRPDHLKPCAFFFSPAGCRNGQTCKFSHDPQSQNAATAVVAPAPVPTKAATPHVAAVTSSIPPRQPTYSAPTAVKSAPEAKHVSKSKEDHHDARPKKSRRQEVDSDSSSDEDLDIPVVKKDNKPAPASSKQSVSVAAAPVHAVPPALPSAASMEAMFQNQLQALLNQQKMEYEKSMAEQMKKFEMVMQSQKQQSTQLHAATALPTPARETKTVQQPAAKQSTAKKPAKSPANGSKNSAQAGDEDDDTEFLFNAVNSALNHTQQTPSPVKGLSMVQQQLNKSQQEQQLQKAKNTHSFPPPGFPALAASTGEKSAQSTPVQDKKRRSLTVSATKTGNADAAPLAPMIAFPTETSVVPVAAGLPSRFSGEVSHLLSKKKFVWAELVQLTQANNRFSGDFNFDSLIDAAWVTTRPPADCKGKKVHDIIAIDCEMCQSEDPLTGNKDHGALVRVSVVSGTNYDEVCLYLKHL